MVKISLPKIEGIAPITTETRGFIQEEYEAVGQSHWNKTSTYSTLSIALKPSRPHYQLYTKGIRFESEQLFDLGGRLLAIISILIGLSNILT